MPSPPSRNPVLLEGQVELPHALSVHRLALAEDGLVGHWPEAPCKLAPYRCATGGRTTRTVPKDFYKGFAVEFHSEKTISDL